MLIDKDKLLTDIAQKAKEELADANHNYLQGFQDCIEVIEAQEDAYKWHDVAVEEDVPDDDRIVLMSFANNPCAPAAGWYERDEDGGGRFTDGGQKPLSEYGLVVDGWWEMPIKPEDEEAFAFRRLCDQIYKEIKEGK